MSRLSEYDLERYAEVLGWALQTSRKVPFQNGDMVVIRYDVEALPLVEAVYRLLVDAHLNPLPVARLTPAMEEEHYLNTSMGQLIYQPPGEMELYGHCAGVLTILAPGRVDHLKEVDPRILNSAQEANTGVSDLIERRKRLGEVGWTICVYPTRALAEAAAIPYEDYADMVLRASFIKGPEPVKAWKRHRKELGEVSAWLNSLKAKAFRVNSENMDLLVEPGRFRRFVAVTGQNVPASEVYVSPDWRGVTGRFHADMPSIRAGRIVSGATLDFDGGMLVRAKAKRGYSFLVNQVAAVHGAARLGEFSLTDRRFSQVDEFLGHPLLDENYGGDTGNCHVALGASAPETYAGPAYELDHDLLTGLGFNISTIHWDLVNTEPKTVTATLVDGSRKVVYENGMFAI